MLEQDFHILQRTRLDVQLSNLFRNWDASATARAEFVRWAWQVAEAADVAAAEDRDLAAALMRKERDITHAQLAARLHATSTVDLVLVNKRMFLDWLADAVLSERAAA